MMIMTCRTVGISIDRPCAEVYHFLAQPDNFAQWASGVDTTAKMTTTPPTYPIDRTCRY
ncbi:hypothetical protein [Amycolatopsis sp. GM8]|uniref:hypothetical protein n=1 Tax=Amycolatopsis sp. GM8 TaxID=2896530 RepID=UPI001F342ADF|nr:hypothetical protein [Amycolatopsis sp. GM8]